MLSALFESVDESHIQAQVDVGARETVGLEFKEALYARNDNGTKELLKDVSAFANIAGGDLIIGIAEEDSVAARLSPIVMLDISAELLRIEQQIRNGIDPPIPGVRVKAIEIASGGHAILIRVPKSWAAPHRVSARGSNKFYVRHSSGVDEASMNELRELFQTQAQFQERASNFKALRLKEIERNRTPKPLAPELSRLIVHILPLAMFSTVPPSIDLEAAYALHALFHPLDGAGHTPDFNLEGFLVHRGGEKCFGYTQIYRTGGVEATKVGITGNGRGYPTLPSLKLEQILIHHLPTYLEGLEKLGVNAPLLVFITLRGMKGVRYAVRKSPYDDDPPPFMSDTVELPAIFIDSFGSAQSYQPKIRPSLDVLWNAAGYSKSQYFNDNGVWIGRDR